MTQISNNHPFQHIIVRDDGTGRWFLIPHGEEDNFISWSKGYDWIRSGPDGPTRFDQYEIFAPIFQQDRK